jgi:hypothetical protein
MATQSGQRVARHNPEGHSGSGRRGSRNQRYIPAQRVEGRIAESAVKRPNSMGFAAAYDSTCPTSGKDPQSYRTSASRAALTELMFLNVKVEHRFDRKAWRMKPVVFRDLTLEAMAKAKSACEAVQRAIDYTDALEAKGETIPARGLNPELDAIVDAADAATQEMEEAIAKLKAAP